MKKIKSERGSMTVYVIIAFLFCMAIMMNLYWTSTNNQITVLQAVQRVKAIYEDDVNNIDEIYENINSQTQVV